MAELILKATLILAAAGLLSALLRRAPAAARHLVWTVALAAILLLPLLSLYTPRVAVNVTVNLPAPILAEATTADPPAAPEPATRNWVLWVWCFGAAIVTVRILAGAALVKWIVRAPQPAATDLQQLFSELARQLGIRRRLRLIECPHAPVPMTYGVLRPVVVLPPESASWQPEQKRLVLLHELVHVRRGDTVVHWVAQIACAVYWFHPLAWLAAFRLRRERERACDDAVLNLGARGSEYAAHLLELTRLLRDRAVHRRWAGTPVVGMAHVSDLEDRVRAMLNPSLNRHLSRKAIYAALAIACIVVVSLAALHAQARGEVASLTLTIADASGGRIPNAKVLFINQDAPKNKEVGIANAAGEVSFNAIPAGHYTIEVRAPGFKLRSHQVELTSSLTGRYDVVLEVGNVSETVEVVAQAPSRPAASTAPKAGTASQRIRVGGNIQATKLLKQARPAYPEHAKEAGIQGMVLLQAVISKEGDLLSLGVANTLADPELAKAAMDAVQQWKYKPTLLNGQPVEVSTTIEVRFRLTN